MASALTQAHRVAQLRLGAATVVRLRAVWDLLDPDDIDGTFDEWAMTAVAVVQASRSQSARLAGNYINAVRASEVSGSFDPILANTIDRKALTTSLLVTGPVSFRANLTRMPAPRALAIAEERSARAGMRHALNGGRETITETMKADPRGVAYERVASGNACNYCADLTGIRFKTDEVFRPHDGCSCAAMPVYA